MANQALSLQPYVGSAWSIENPEAVLAFLSWLTAKNKKFADEVDYEGFEIEGLPEGAIP